MKKISLMLTAVMMSAFLLTGCGGKKAEEEKKEEGTAEYSAKVNEVFTCGSYDGTVLVVNMDVTNNTDTYMESSHPTYDLEVSVDGTVLSDSYISDENPYYVASKKIAAGETGIAQAVFDLKKVDYKDDSEIKLILTAYTIEDYKQITVMDETMTMADVEAKVSESEFDVSVDNVTITDDGEGHNVIVIDYTFTNNSDEATSFGSAVEANLFQDGVALSSGYLNYKHPLADEEGFEKAYTDVKSGGSVKIRSVYQLTSSSNVEIQLIDRISFDNAEILNTEIKVDVPNESDSDDKDDDKEDKDLKDSEADDSL